VSQTDLCSNCGLNPVWWRSDKRCRECSDRSGNLYLSRVIVDVDKVLSFFDGDRTRAESFLKTCEDREAFLG
jgi:hypothetical protein